MKEKSRWVTECIEKMFKWIGRRSSWKVVVVLNGGLLDASLGKSLGNSVYQVIMHQANVAANADAVIDRLIQIGMERVLFILDSTRYSGKDLLSLLKYYVGRFEDLNVHGHSSLAEQRGKVCHMLYENYISGHWGVAVVSRVGDIWKLHASEPLKASGHLMPCVSKDGEKLHGLNEINQWIDWCFKKLDNRETH